MFQATFIGHQGWLLEARETRLLVDPLLADSFGNTPGSEALLFPPREIDFERFPPISAVLLTHEHEDHLCPASLDRLSRDIPIYLSANSSSAAATLLREMGFEVLRVSPGQHLTLGELNLLALGPGHGRSETSDEWDVLPFLVWDREGHGSFFTSVDVPPSDEMFQRARVHVPQLGVFALSVNTMHMGWRSLEARPADPSDQLLKLSRNILELHARLSRVWSPAAAFAVGSTGFAFQGELGWLNRNAFILDTEQVLEALRQLELPLPSVMLAPRPGQTLVMEQGQPCRVEARDFLRTPPPRQWPDRTLVGDQPATPPDYGPACGRREVGETEREELETHLATLAQYLYGTRLYQDLLTLHTDELRGRRRTIALVLKRAEGAAWVYEYHPQQCCFVQGEQADPFSTYPAGIECWATDLLAMFEGRVVASSGVGLGRSRVWSALPGRFQGLFNQVFVKFFHPLRHPRQALANYRRLYAAVEAGRSSGPRVPAQRR